MLKELKKCDDIEGLEKKVRKENEFYQGKIIVVDDEPNVFESAIEYLVETCGYNVEFLNNIQDAISLVKKAYENKNPYHLLISDIRMGEEGKDDGPALLENLKKEENVLAYIPTIFFSGWFSAKQKERIKGLGDYPIFGKPFQHEKILPTLADSVKKGKELYKNSDIFDLPEGNGYVIGIPVPK